MLGAGQPFRIKRGSVKETPRLLPTSGYLVIHPPIHQLFVAHVPRSQSQEADQEKSTFGACSNSDFKRSQNWVPSKQP